MILVWYQTFARPAPVLSPTGKKIKIKSFCRKAENYYKIKKLPSRKNVCVKSC